MYLSSCQIFYFRKAKLPDFQLVLEQAETLMEEVNIAEDHKAMKLRVLTTLAGFYMKKSRETVRWWPRLMSIPVVLCHT